MLTIEISVLQIKLVSVTALRRNAIKTFCFTYKIDNQPVNISTHFQVCFRYVTESFLQSEKQYIYTMYVGMRHPAAVALIARGRYQHTLWQPRLLSFGKAIQIMQYRHVRMCGRLYRKIFLNVGQPNIYAASSNWMWK